MAEEQQQQTQQKMTDEGAEAGCRKVAIAVDSSENSKFAFRCEYIHSSHYRCDLV